MKRRGYAIEGVEYLKIGIDTVNDLRHKLSFEKQRVLEKHHPYDFFNFVVTAWHLYHDWMKHDKDNRPRLFYKKVNSSPQQMKDLVNAIRDLANGSKHFSLDKPSDEKKVVTDIHEPEIRNFYTYFFGAQSGISIAESYYTIGELVEIIDNYFNWLFDDSISSDDFPESIFKIIVSRSQSSNA